MQWLPEEDTEDNVDSYDYEHISMPRGQSRDEFSRRSHVDVMTQKLRQHLPCFFTFGANRGDSLDDNVLVGVGRL